MFAVSGIAVVCFFLLHYPGTAPRLQRLLNEGVLDETKKPVRLCAESRKTFVEIG